LINLVDGGHLGFAVTRLNHKNDVKCELPGPTKHRKLALISIAGHTIETPVSKMVNGSHLGFLSQNNVESLRKCQK